MSDITITFTLPLSWLSFLTWSGFWVVYLYLGLGFLVFVAGNCIRHAMNGRLRFLKVWGNRRAPYGALITVALWPYWLLYGIWVRVTERRK